MSKIFDSKNNTKQKFIDSIDDNILSKMIFLYNAINDGWKIEKQENMYIFRKKHEDKQEIYSEDYLEEFITKQFNIYKILDN